VHPPNVPWADSRHPCRRRTGFPLLPVRPTLPSERLGESSGASRETPLEPSLLRGLNPSTQVSRPDSSSRSERLYRCGTAPGFHRTSLILRHSGRSRSTGTTAGKRAKSIADRAAPPDCDQAHTHGWLSAIRGVAAGASVARTYGYSSSFARPDGNRPKPVTQGAQKHALLRCW